MNAQSPPYAAVVLEPHVMPFRTLGEAWDSFRSHVLAGNDANAALQSLMHMTFFAGASALYSTQINTMGATAAETSVALSKLHSELAMFCELSNSIIASMTGKMQ